MMNKDNLIKTILKKKIYIILITIIFAVTGICYTLANVKFVSEHKILIGTSENSNLVNTYKEFVTGSIVLDEVINNLGLSMNIQELSRLVEVETIQNTNMISIKIHGENEQMVNIISNELNDVFINKVKSIYQNDEIYNIDCTTKTTYGNNVGLVGVCSGIFGCLIATILFAVSHILDTKVKSCKDIEEITGLKSLISIPRVKPIFKKKLTIKNIRTQKSEIFKTLMTNIQFFNINNLGSKSIFVTSVMPLEGKTYVSNNLAMEFAKAGKKVILIDSDLRRGKIAKIYNLPNNLGFSNYLSNLDSNGNVIHERITKFINDTEIKNLSVITSGNVPPNPIELMKNQKMKELIKDLKVFYDIIIFDGVPILEAPESQILSKVSDLTLMLSSYGKTKKSELILANQKINTNEESIIAVGFNSIPDRKVKKRLNSIKNNIRNFFSNLDEKISSFAETIKEKKSLLKKIIQSIKNKTKIAILGIKNKLKNIKESIKNRNQKIKLIEAGSMIYEENNIIKDVFESEIAKWELSSSSNALDEHDMSQNKQENIFQEQKTIKSKFDLILEQKERMENDKSNPIPMDEIETIEKGIKIPQKNEIVEIIQEEKIENNQKRYRMKKKNQFFKEREAEKRKKCNPNVELGYEELKEKQRLERIKKETEKKEIEEDEIDDMYEADFQNQEVLTEEMIRKQVEMDEMQRLIDEEEDTKLKFEKQKLEEKVNKKRERNNRFKEFKNSKMKQFQNLMNSFKTRNEEKNIENNENRIQKNEERMKKKQQKENERLENKVRLEKVKEEKKMYKELKKQKHKEEVRINEEIQEDNLYPRFRI